MNLTCKIGPKTYIYHEIFPRGFSILASQCIIEFNVHLPPKLLENGAAVVRTSYQVTLERLCADAHSSSTANVQAVPSSSSFSFEIVVSSVLLHLSHSCRVTGPHTDFLLSALGDAHFTRHSLPQ